MVSVFENYYDKKLSTNEVNGILEIAELEYKVKTLENMYSMSITVRDIDNISQLIKNEIDILNSRIELLEIEND